MSGIETEFDIQEITNLEKDGEFHYIRFVFSDLHGIPRAISVPRRHLQDVIKSGFSAPMALTMIGTRCDLIFPKELVGKNFGNYTHKAMPGTFQQILISNNTNTNENNAQKVSKIGQVLCETFLQSFNKEILPVEACSRYIARKQIKELEKLGLEIKTSFEVEFIAYENDSLKPVFTGSDILSLLRLSKFENYLYDIEKRLSYASLDTEFVQIEHGAGQFEYGMKPVKGILSADSLFLIKQIIKEASLERNWTATFMSKPFDDASTTGLHLNHSLWHNSDNKFHDKNSADGISNLMKCWVAGLLEHGAALSALCCPTVNCYRRLHYPFAPDRIDWDLDNRYSTFRLKNNTESATYVENRLPSGACNPYIALAATIAAGLDGVKRKLELKPIKCNEAILEKNGDLTLTGGTGKLLPNTLEEALQELEKDQIIIDALGEQFIRWFCQCKRVTEIKPIKQLKTEEEKFEKERELYYELI